MKKPTPSSIIVLPTGPKPDQHQILVALWNLYDAWYFQPDKTNAQFDAMDGAIKVLQYFQVDNPRKKDSSQ